MSDPHEPSPRWREVVENNLLLKQAIGDLKEIKAAQAVDHMVAIQLRDKLNNHDTIERVDTLWENMSEIKFLVKVIAGLLSLVVVIVGILTFTHLAFKWP